jgi:hypothetical protein
MTDSQGKAGSLLWVERCQESGKLPLKVPLAGLYASCRQLDSSTLCLLMSKELLKPIQRHRVLPGVGIVFQVKVNLDAIGESVDLPSLLDNTALQVAEDRPRAA